MRMSFLLVILISTASICDADTVSGENMGGFYLMKTPDQRAANQEKYFASEYMQINMRQGINGTDSRPGFLTGLALSGGGIRSSAYQLGLLSGLYKSNKLTKVDYISSVSGGSWANGAYWASTLADKDFFDCLDKAAKFGTKIADCNSAVLLNAEQPFAELPVDKANSYKLRARKRQWKDYIESVYLPDCNLDAEDLKRNPLEPVKPECVRNYASKPYIIVNASHSVEFLDQKGNVKNMPFQFTFDSFGTLADCYPVDTCKKPLRYGFFVRPLSSEFLWVSKTLFLDDQPENSLSSALAASSGVVSGPVLLSYEYELLTNPRTSMLGNQRGDNIESIRKEIVLSDGGKSENLGLVPLVERGANLIVISYMGKDDDLEKNPWEDLELAAKQVKNLLNCDVQIPDKKVDLTSNFIVESTYSCAKYSGNILHVKASYKNATKFITYLDKENFKDLSEYLKVTDVAKNNGSKKNDRFPQTKTMAQFYDEELIRAYYLFGQWIAKEQLSDKMVKK